MVKRCATLYEYGIFVDMAREYRKTMSLEEAIQKAVMDCIDKNVLKEFLKRYKREVVNMMRKEWNMDVALKVEKEEGIVIGRKEGRVEVAKNLRAKGMSIEEVAEATGLTVDDILRL